MADTIREYLVSLGFSVNEAQLHTFRDALSGTASSATKLGAEVVGVGIAITEMVEQVARHFENLYYMSQRTGSTVASLDAVGFAARQVGLSADQSRGAVEAFSHSLRLNPGLRGMLAGLGVGAGDPESQVRGLVKRLSRMPDFVGIQMAQQFGIPEEVYLHYKNNMRELERAEEEHRKRMREAGLDADVEARKFTEFTRVLNTMEDSFSILGTRIAHDWRDPVQGMIKDIGNLVDGFNNADKASNGILGKIGSLVAAFGGITAVLAILGRLFGFKGVGLAAGVVGGGGIAGAGLAAAGAVMGDEKQSMDLRTGLRALLGIDDPHEPLPWSASGSWGTRRHIRSTRPWGDPSDAAPYRPPVGASSRVWGDNEAVAAGLYDPAPIGGAAAGGKSAAVTVNQTNNITGSFRDIEQMREKIKGTNNDMERALADVVRNLSAKVQ